MALCLSTVLTGCQGGNMPGSGKATPVAVKLAPDVDNYLQELSKIKQESLQKVIEPYAAATAEGAKYLSGKSSIAERKRHAPDILKQMKMCSASLTPIQKSAANLACPSSCDDVKKHFEAYLAGFKKELEITIEFVTACTGDKPATDPAMIAISQKLARASQERSLENNLFQNEVKKLTEKS